MASLKFYFFKLNPKRWLFQNKTTLIKTRSMKKQKRLMLAWTIATTFEIVCLTYLLQSYTTTPQDILLQDLWKSHSDILELCRKEFNVCIETSKCIKWSQRCDRYVDCPDQSDELYCECLLDEFACSSGECVNLNYVCDSVVDCSSGEDESDAKCEICQKDQYLCHSSKKCINKELVCNNMVDCISGDDERDCVDFGRNNELVLNKPLSGGFLVCYNGWVKEYEKYFCGNKNQNLLLKNLPTEPIESYPLKSNNATSYVELVIGENNVPKLVESEKCHEDKVVALRCAMEDCGRRKIKDELYDISRFYGREASLGEFPWFARVMPQMQGEVDECGGSLVGSRWVVTLSRCAQQWISKNNTYVDAKNLYVRLGNIDKLSKYWLLRKVEKIFHHKYEHNDKNDIAVLKLSEEVEYTKFIQPICLFHNKTFHLKNYQYCKLIGFGAHVKGGFPRLLYSSEVNPEALENSLTQLEVGKAKGGLYGQLCHLDYGVPLICKSRDQNKWSLAGLVSHTDFENPNADPMEPTMFYDQGCNKVMATAFTYDHSKWVMKTIKEDFLV